MASWRSNLASRKAIYTVDLGGGGYGVVCRSILFLDGEAGDQQKRIGHILPFCRSSLCDDGGG